MDVFIRIKRLVLARRVVFTEKAEIEMSADDLTPELVYESIVNSPGIIKVLRSRNPRTKVSERLYVIKGLTFDGLDVYTKGKIVTKKGVDVFYVLISSKKTRISEPFPCPECGKEGVITVVETCDLSDGLIVKKLRHLKCRFCGTRLFDDDAMHCIQQYRVTHHAGSR